jgi:hypothetical protein
MRDWTIERSLPLSYSYNSGKRWYIPAGGFDHTIAVFEASTPCTPLDNLAIRVGWNISRNVE